MIEDERSQAPRGRGPGRVALTRALLAGGAGTLLGGLLVAHPATTGHWPGPALLLLVPALALLLASTAVATAWVESWRPTRPRAGPLVVATASAVVAGGLLGEAVWLSGQWRQGALDGGLQALDGALRALVEQDGRLRLGVVAGLALASGVPAAAIVRRRLLGDGPGETFLRGLRGTLEVAVTAIVTTVPVLVVTRPTDPLAPLAAATAGGGAALVLAAPLLVPTWTILLAAADRLTHRLGRGPGSSDGSPAHAGHALATDRSPANSAVC